jgi:hypothetical protein
MLLQQITGSARAGDGILDHALVAGSDKTQVGEQVPYLHVRLREGMQADRHSYLSDQRPCCIRRAGGWSPTPMFVCVAPQLSRADELPKEGWRPARENWHATTIAGYVA